MASLKKKGPTYYAQYYMGGKQKRLCLHTSSLQIAKEKLRKLESSLFQGDDLPFPTRTPIGEVVADYVTHIQTVKTARSVTPDLFYLRMAFGPVCEALTRPKRPKPKYVRRKKNPPKPKKVKVPPMEAQCFEAITTAQIASFIGSVARARGLAPKTANRYREILCRLYNWAQAQRGIRLPNDRNPAAKVERYKEKASRIRFLTLPQIDEQLKALEDHHQLQTMVSMYIYAGLRREEALWLQVGDLDFKQGAYGMIRVQAKEVAGDYWEPKTKVNRAVPISSSLRYYLERYVPAPSAGGWYFPSPEGKRYDPDNFSRDLRSVQLKRGLSWACLVYRHTFGSQLAMKGDSLYKISTLMGNSPEICRRHYAALLPEALTGSVEFAQGDPLGDPASVSRPPRKGISVAV
jgi:integrase